jgi:hypothetical protein
MVTASDDAYAVTHLLKPPQATIGWGYLPLRVVRHPGKHRHLVTAAREVLR